jgi:hypothetical protein
MATLPHSQIPVQFDDPTLFEEVACDEPSPFDHDSEWWSEVQPEHPEDLDRSTVWGSMLADEMWLASQPPPNFPEWLVGQSELYQSQGTPEGAFVGRLLSDLADAAFALKAETVIDFEARDAEMKDCGLRRIGR